MSYQIQFRRGEKQDLPLLANGEPALTEDTTELFIGTPNGNKRLTFDATKHQDLEASINSVAGINIQYPPAPLVAAKGVSKSSTGYIPANSLNVVAVLNPEYFNVGDKVFVDGGVREKRNIAFTSPTYENAVNGTITITTPEGVSVSVPFTQGNTGTAIAMKFEEKASEFTGWTLQRSNGLITLTSETYGDKGDFTINTGGTGVTTSSTGSQDGSVGSFPATVTGVSTYYIELDTNASGEMDASTTVYHDATDAILALIDYANGNELFVPKDDFFVSQDIDMTKLHGEGRILKDGIYTQVPNKIRDLNEQLAQIKKKVVGTINVKEFDSVQEAINYASTLQSPYDLFNGSNSSGFIEINFGGFCEVDEPVVLPMKMSGFIFTNGVLSASDIFVGDFVLKPSAIAPLAYHYLFFENFHINGNHKASCLQLNNYNRIIMNNVVLTGYTEFGLQDGLFSGANGHELYANNLFIGQYEWNDSRRGTQTKGLAMQVNALDGHFTNLVVFDSYQGIEINAESNFFNMLHIWGCVDKENGLIINTSTQINMGYIDGVSVTIKNPYGVHLTNFRFLALSSYTDGDSNPNAYIILKAEGVDKAISRLVITGCIFRNQGTKTMNMIDIDEANGNFKLANTNSCTIEGNTKNGTVNMVYSEFSKERRVTNTAIRTIDFTNELKLTIAVWVKSAVYIDELGKAPIQSITASGMVVTHKLNSDTIGTELKSDGKVMITASINNPYLS